MFFKDVNKKDFLHRGVYSRMQKLICLSKIQMEHLKNCLPLEEKQYTVIPNGVDIQRFQPRNPDKRLRQELGAGDFEFLVGMIGRFDPQKGQLELVQAAREIVDRHPHCRFVFVGADTHRESSIRRKVDGLIAELNLKQYVTTTEHRSDIPRVLNALDAFAMPSYEENFGNVMLEAIASGLPCIGTSSGGTPEIIVDGVSGLLVPPKDPRALARAVFKFIEDPDTRKQLGDKARKRAEERFDIKKVFIQIRSLIDDANS
jgi:glycosyltransferase involved in cell wall biosynthesis